MFHHVSIKLHVLVVVSTFYKLPGFFKQTMSFLLALLLPILVASFTYVMTWVFTTEDSVWFQPCMMRWCAIFFNTSCLIVFFAMCGFCLSTSTDHCRAKHPVLQLPGAQNGPSCKHHRRRRPGKRWVRPLLGCWLVRQKNLGEEPGKGRVVAFGRFGFCLVQLEVRNIEIAIKSYDLKSSNHHTKCWVKHSKFMDQTASKPIVILLPYPFLSFFKLSNQNRYKAPTVPNAAPGLQTQGRARVAPPLAAAPTASPAAQREVGPQAGQSNLENVEKTWKKTARQNDWRLFLFLSKKRLY